MAAPWPEPVQCSVIVLCAPAPEHYAFLLQVPENLLNNPQFGISPEVAYHRAMVLTNAQLHRLPDVDDSMSGTTAIAALIRGRTVYVANVGDSRCVLAERQGDRLIAQDLSFDQTPFRCEQRQHTRAGG